MTKLKQNLITGSIFSEFLAVIGFNSREVASPGSSWQHQQQDGEFL
jgi:hypothetical protein